MALDKRYKKQFVDGAVANDIPKNAAETAYDIIARFGGYGYNKSHAVAYGLIAYQTAYLKANYYKHFMAVLLTYRSYCKDMMKRLIAECEKHRVAVLPFDGDKGEYHFTVDNDKITPHCANFRK